MTRRNKNVNAEFLSGRPRAACRPSSWPGSTSTSERFPGEPVATRTASGSARSCSSRRPSRLLCLTSSGSSQRSQPSTIWPKADEQHVLKLWEGLGYYRRARHLHAAARLIVAERNGMLPDDPEVWAALPGVGRYILGAVLSQAFDRPLPIVEANSLRVLRRLFGYRGDPRVGEGKAWVWSAAESVLPTKRAGDFNQALMELGALVCTPTAPQCDRCPLARQCVARREGLAGGHSAAEETARATARGGSRRGHPRP